MQRSLENLENQLIQCANTTYGGRYVFGGYNTVEVPFKIETDLNGNNSFIYNVADLITVMKLFLIN